MQDEVIMKKKIEALVEKAAAARHMYYELHFSEKHEEAKNFEKPNIIDQKT